MAEKLVVTPKKSSRTVSVEHSEHYVAGQIGGRFRKRTIGTMDLERWEGSKGNMRPMFYDKLKKFALKKEDGTYYTAKEAALFPKKFPLTFEYPQVTRKDHRIGQPIERCNIHDCDDPYLNHPMFQSITSEGELALDPLDPYYEIKAAAVRGNRDVKTASDNEVYAGNVRAILSDKVTDQKIKAKKRREKISAYTLLQNMDRDRRIAVLRALGNVIDDNAHPDSIEEALFVYVDDNVTTEQGMTRQKLFVKYAEMDMNELLLKQLIQYAYKSHIIVQQRGTFKFEGTPLGTTLTAVEEFFRDPENYNVFETLEMLVAEKKRQRQVAADASITQDIKVDNTPILDEEE